MLRVFNQTARYVDQGGGRRKGSFAMFLETHHPDLLSFLDLKKNHGVEEDRARDLFYGLWISDLFMKRVEKVVFGHSFVHTHALIYRMHGESSMNKNTLRTKQPARHTTPCPHAKFGKPS